MALAMPYVVCSCSCRDPAVQLEGMNPATWADHGSCTEARTGNGKGNAIAPCRRRSRPVAAWLQTSVLSATQQESNKNHRLSHNLRSQTSGDQGSHGREEVYLFPSATALRHSKGCSGRSMPFPCSCHAFAMLHALPMPWLRPWHEHGKTMARAWQEHCNNMATRWQ